MVAERNHIYSLVPGKELLDGSEQEHTVSRKAFPSITRILNASSLLLNIFFIAYIASHASHQSRPSQAWSILGDSPTYPVPFLHFSNYSSPDGANNKELRTKWNDIKGEHGIVVVDHNWAAAHGLPQALSLPSDHTKGIYLIDAYHSLHCLLSIRQSWYRLRDHGAEPYESEEEYRGAESHYSHCFDYLLQSIVCNPSDHLFAHQNRLKPGDGQERQCRDWRVLQDWATANSACDINDTDGENPRLLENPRLCHGKDDMVPHRINTV